MAQKPEKTPWLPEVKPPADLTQNIIAAILSEPAPAWEVVQSPTTNTPERMHTLRAYFITGLICALAFYLLLPVLPTALWVHFKQTTGLFAQVAHIITASFHLAMDCFASLATLVRPLLVIAMHIGRAWASLIQIATTGPLWPFSLAILVLTLMGNSLLIRILTGQHLLSRS